MWLLKTLDDLKKLQIKIYKTHFDNKISSYLKLYIQLGPYNKIFSLIGKFWNVVKLFFIL